MTQEPLKFIPDNHPAYERAKVYVLRSEPMGKMSLSRFVLLSKPMLANKALLQQILEEQDKQTGFVVDATATPQKARELMIAQGIRPENNAFSSAIKHSREGE